MDALRAEFPSLARIAKPAVAREPLAWALVSGIGAGVVVGAIARLALLVLSSLLLPPTQPHPEWLTTLSLGTVAAAIATGAVLVRAGGFAAVAAYIVYELLVLLVSLPARLILCATVLPPLGLSCDYLALVRDHWATWVGLLVGIPAGFALLRATPGENRLLRAAGAFSVVLLAFTLPASWLFATPPESAQNVILAVFTLANVLAAVVAGVLLARDRLVTAVLLAVLVAAPDLAFALPNALRGGSYAEDLTFTIARWAGVFIPVASVAALLFARAYLRGHLAAEGTFS